MDRACLKSLFSGDVLWYHIFCFSSEYIISAERISPTSFLKWVWRLLFLLIKNPKPNCLFEWNFFHLEEDVVRILWGEEEKTTQRFKEHQIYFISDQEEILFSWRLKKKIFSSSRTLVKKYMNSSACLICTSQWILGARLR